MKLPNFLIPLIAFTFLISTSYLLYIQQLPVKTNTWFSGSGVCETCHSTNTKTLRDNQGNDVSPVSHWRSTMLANASKDPFWKAKVKHEGIENSAHKDALENVCTRCHAPMGMVNALLTTQDVYNLDVLQNDDLGKDGISCTLCHQIDDFSSPLFSGNFHINTSKEIYGSFQNPLVQQMKVNSGYTPVYSEKINNSRLCGSCHTLITNSVDEDGEFTGHTFIEQAIYHEWENSVFKEQNISCQSCHLPRINDPVIISSRPGTTSGRTPFGIHDFTGGNVFMLTLLKENHDQLELNSGTDLLAQTIQRTTKLLTEQTIDLDISNINYSNDSVFVTINLKNKAGHKFPSGFPSRRAFLEFLVSNNSDTLFHSGKPGAAALINTSEETFEPHHQVINDDKQVQLYEFVMGNTEGKVTTVLEKAYVPLKDNRMVPQGFQKQNSNYDTVKVVGRAVEDPDYFSGTGIESIIYALPLARIGTLAKVNVYLHYQTVPEPWVFELFTKADEDADINRFKEMYFKSNRTGIVVASDSAQITGTSIQGIEHGNYRIYPIPATEKIRIDGIEETTGFSIFTADGKWIKGGTVEMNNSQINLGLQSGFYLLVLQSSKDKFSTPLIVK
jgi:hypothetical protein